MSPSGRFCVGNPSRGAPAISKDGGDGTSDSVGGSSPERPLVPLSCGEEGRSSLRPAKGGDVGSSHRGRQGAPPGAPPFSRGPPL
eukprot:3561216-Amphidinium_carterae.1